MSTLLRVEGYNSVKLLTKIYYYKSTFLALGATCYTSNSLRNLEKPHGTMVKNKDPKSHLLVSSHSSAPYKLNDPEQQISRPRFSHLHKRSKISFTELLDGSTAKLIDKFT